MEERLLVLTEYKHDIVRNVKKGLSALKNKVEYIYEKSNIRLIAKQIVNEAIINFLNIKDISKLKQTEVKKSREKIEDFINFLKKKEIESIIETGEDKFGLNKIYREYMDKVEEVVNNRRLPEEESKIIYEEVQTHINIQLHNKLFKKSPSPLDITFLKKLKSLEWLKPEQVGVSENFVESKIWKEAIESTFIVKCRF